MSQRSSRVIVVAGALTQPHWVPPAELRARLRSLSACDDLRTEEADLPAVSAALPRELAHDRWLRLQSWPADISIAPGAMSAVRRLAPFDVDRSGWLIEPVHFHLAKDHVILLAGAAHDLEAEDAGRLAASILPLFEEDSSSLSVLTPRLWFMSPQQLPPDASQPGSSQPDAWLQLECSSSEAAAGRNINGYLPAGSDARRFRKLLNEIQMTWHEHPVNQRREAERRLPINSIWLSGPVAAPAAAAWKQAVADGRYAFEESLLTPRLADDRSAWLDAMQALDGRIQLWLAAAQPPAILLCGDTTVRWLQRGPSGRGATARRAFGNGVSAIGRRLRHLAGRLREQPVAGGSEAAATDPLVQMFLEAS